MANKPTLSARAIETSIFPPGGDLNEFLFHHLRRDDLEGQVLAVTSKIVSLAENRVEPAGSIDREALARREADFYLGEGGYGSHLTIKHGMLIPSSGIDESNSASGGFILYPKDPFASARRIHEALKARFNLRQLGILIADSHSMPLRRGVTGFSLAHWGIRATESLIGQPDLFRRKLKFTHVDVVDSLAATAVLVMGEADDCTPLALIRGARVEFTETTVAEELLVTPEDDLYLPLLAPHLARTKA